MNMKTNRKSLPKITLFFSKGDKRISLRPTIRKTHYFLKNKADSYIKKGFSITFRVSYPDGSTNSGTYTKLVDLNWAYQAFVKEFIHEAYDQHI